MPHVSIVESTLRPEPAHNLATVPLLWMTSLLTLRHLVGTMLLVGIVGTGRGGRSPDIAEPSTDLPPKVLYAWCCSLLLGWSNMQVFGSVFLGVFCVSRLLERNTVCFPDSCIQ